MYKIRIVKRRKDGLPLLLINNKDNNIWIGHTDIKNFLYDFIIAIGKFDAEMEEFKKNKGGEI